MMGSGIFFRSPACNTDISIWGYVWEWQNSKGTREMVHDEERAQNRRQRKVGGELASCSLLITYERSVCYICPRRSTYLPTKNNQFIKYLTAREGLPNKYNRVPFFFVLIFLYSLGGANIFTTLCYTKSVRTIQMVFDYYYLIQRPSWIPYFCTNITKFESLRMPAIQ